MKNFFKVVVIAAYVGMVGCAPKPVPVQWTPTGGSRADATVEIGVIYDPNYEYPLTQPDRMLEMARERCRHGVMPMPNYSGNLLNDAPLGL